MTVVAEGGALATRCPAMSGHRLSATRVGLRPPLHQTIPYVGNSTVWQGGTGESGSLPARHQPHSTAITTLTTRRPPSLSVSRNILIHTHLPAHSLHSPHLAHPIYAHCAVGWGL